MQIVSTFSAFDLKSLQLHDNIPPFFNYLNIMDCFLRAQMAHNNYDAVLRNSPLPLLFEIGRNHPVPLPVSDNVNQHRLESSWTDRSACGSKLISGIPPPLSFEIDLSSLPKNQDEDSTSVYNKGMSYFNKCSWKNWSACNTVQPNIASTSPLDWTLKGIIAVLVAAFFCFFISAWIREKFWQFTTGVGLVFIPALFLACIYSAFRLFGLLAIWGASTVLILFAFNRVREKVQIKPALSWGLAVGVLLLLAYNLTPWWNTYINQPDAEPFNWREGVSIWPSQLLRLSVVLFAGVFFWWGRSRIIKMQEELQEQECDGKTTRIFALPKAPEELGYCKVLFIGNWEINKENPHHVYPNELWKKYLGYFGLDMKVSPLTTGFAGLSGVRTTNFHSLAGCGQHLFITRVMVSYGARVLKYHFLVGFGG